jgi:cell division protein FtsZ
MLIEPGNLMDQKARIFVIGVGGGGGNALNRMIEEGMTNVDFVAMNTDAQDLEYNNSQTKLQIGKELTKGLGAGANSDIGKQAVEENKEIIAKTLKNAHMVFITAGMGGGTGTGAAPAIARISKELGILTVGVVTKPFKFEGPMRKNRAEEGVSELKKNCDTVLVIPNETLLEITDQKTTVTDTFKIADTVLLQATKGISDLINVPGLINLDFADVSRVMQNGGDAIMGTGMARGEERAILAANQAINSPLLQNKSIKGARGVLINITSSDDLGIHELEQASDIIYKAAGYDSDEHIDQDHGEIIHGFTVDNSLKDEVRVTVIATGLDKESDTESEDDSNIISENISRYTIPDHRYNNPQTSINIINNNEDLEGPGKEQDKIDETTNDINLESKEDESIPVFGNDDLDIPAYLRNRNLD